MPFPAKPWIIHIIAFLSCISFHIFFLEYIFVCLSNSIFYVFIKNLTSHSLEMLRQFSYLSSPSSQNLHRAPSLIQSNFAALQPGTQLFFFCPHHTWGSFSTQVLSILSCTLCVPLSWFTPSLYAAYLPVAPGEAVLWDRFLKLCLQEILFYFFHLSMWVLAC